MKVFGILKPFFQKGLKRVKGSALAGFGRLSPAGACLGVPTINEKSAAPAYPSGMLSRMSRPQRAQNLMDSSRPAIPSPESDRTADRHVCFRLTPSAALSIGCLGRCGGRSFLSIVRLRAKGGDFALCGERPGRRPGPAIFREKLSKAFNLQNAAETY